jgi:hypothetical protein
MHPLDGLFGGWQIIDTVGLQECSPCFCGRALRLPVSVMLLERDTIAATLITCPNEDWCTLARDKDIVFVIHLNIIFGENGDGAGIRRVPHTHEGMGEICERVGFSCLGVEVLKGRNGKFGDLVAQTDFTRGNTHTSRRFAEYGETSPLAVSFTKVMAVCPGIVGDKKAMAMIVVYA